MTTPGPAPLHPAVLDAWPVALQRRFEAIAFDWDGTAVPDRRADASPVRRQIEQLTSLGVDVGVISGTHVENIDGQLQARPAGPGHLYLCVNRGSEIYQADSDGVHLVERRTGTEAGEVALHRPGERTAGAVAAARLTPLQ